MPTRHEVFNHLQITRRPESHITQKHDPMGRAHRLRRTRLEGRRFQTPINPLQIVRMILSADATLQKIGRLSYETRHKKRYRLRHEIENVFENSTAWGALDTFKKSAQNCFLQ